MSDEGNLFRLVVRNRVAQSVIALMEVGSVFEYLEGIVFGSYDFGHE